MEELELIQITKREHKKLLADQLFLEALRAAGVDNWEGYHYAFELLDEWAKEDKAT